MISAAILLLALSLISGHVKCEDTAECSLKTTTTLRGKDPRPFIRHRQLSWVLDYWDEYNKTTHTKSLSDYWDKFGKTTNTTSPNTATNMRRQLLSIAREIFPPDTLLEECNWISK